LCRIWLWFTEDSEVVYGSIILVGGGGATVLLTSLSMIAELIGTNTVGTQEIFKK